MKVRVLLTNTTEAPQEVRENTAIDQVESVEDAKKKYTLLSKIDDLKVSKGAWTKEDEDVMRVVVSRFSDLFSIDKSDLGRMALAEVGKNLEGEEGPIGVPVAANSTSSTQKYEQRARSESDLKIWNADRSKIAG